MVLDITGIAVASFTPSEGIPDGDLFWQVRAFNGAGKASSFSEPGNFSLDATPPAAPTTLDVEQFVPAEGRFTETYTPTFIWSRVTRDTKGQPDEVVRYEVVLDPDTSDAQAAVITGDDTSFTPETPIAFGVHHFFQVRPVDDFENVGIGALFFIDAITGDRLTENPTFTLSAEDFLPAGAHRVEVRAVDQLAAQLTGDADKFQHQSDGAELLCRASDTVVCERVAFFVPSQQAVSQNQTAILEVHIDPLGVEIDGAAISINIPPSLSFNPNTGVTFGDVRPPTILNSADGQFDFEVTFDVTSGDKTLATLELGTSQPGTFVVEFVNSGDRKTVARFLGEDLSITRTDGTIVVPAPPPPPPPPPPPVDDLPPVADAGADLGVCPRIRSWRRKPPRNNLLTVIWTLS